MDLDAILRPFGVQAPTVGGPGPYRWGSTPLGFGFGCFFSRKSARNQVKINYSSSSIARYLYV